MLLTPNLGVAPCASDANPPLRRTKEQERRRKALSVTS